MNYRTLYTMVTEVGVATLKSALLASANFDNFENALHSTSRSMPSPY